MPTLFLLESINEYRTGYIETIATEYGQPDTSQTYGCPTDPNNLWHLNCFSGCGGSRTKPATTQEIVDWGLNRSFTYVIITGGFYSSYKNEVDNYISRGGKVYKLTSKSGCSGPDCHCYYISFDQIILCISNWQCEQPLNRYENDGCGNRRLNSVCNPCVQNWICEIPLNGYEKDGCGNRRQRTDGSCDPCPEVNLVLTVSG